jgi:hypothetical protein
MLMAQIMVILDVSVVNVAPALDREDAVVPWRRLPMDRQRPRGN